MAPKHGTLVVLLVMLSSVDALTCGEGAECLKPISLVQISRVNATQVHADALGEEHGGNKRTETQHGVALMGFEKYAYNMVSKVIAHNTTLDAEEREAINTIIGFVDSMYPLLVEGHKKDITTVSSCGTQLTSCETNRGDLGVTTAKSKMESHRSNHVECRGAEAVRNGSTKTACDIYDNYRQLQADAVPPECVGIDLSSANIKTSDKSVKVVMEACLRLTKKWMDGLWPLYEACEEETTLLDGINHDCNEMQDHFEDAYCQFAVTHQQSCTTYTGCWGSAVTACDLTCVATAASVGARKADNVTAQKIRCLLNIFDAANADKAGALKDCVDATHDTSEWNITCPNVPGEWPPTPPVPPTPCTELTVPCQTPWLTTEYTTQAWYPDVVMQACQVCSLAQPGPSPTPVTPTPDPSPTPVPAPAPLVDYGIRNVNGVQYNRFWWYERSTNTAFPPSGYFTNPFGGCSATDSLCFQQLPSTVTETGKLLVETGTNTYVFQFDAANDVAHQAYLAFSQGIEGKVTDGMNWQPFHKDNPINQFECNWDGIDSFAFGEGAFILDDDHCWCCAVFGASDNGKGKSYCGWSPGNVQGVLGSWQHSDFNCNSQAPNLAFYYAD